MRKIQLTFIIILNIIFSSCGKFDFNVYETNHSKKIIEVTTAYNIARLQKLQNKDTLHLVFTGDTQRFFDDLSDLVNTINDLPQVDAVIITGDLADFGTAREYEWLNEQLIKLKVPFLTVIGNHDCIANGTVLYEEIYGPLNYSFTWNDIRFVMHNTNGREFSFNGTVPDLTWMQQQLSDTAQYRCCIFASHVPPDNEDFDAALVNNYIRLIREAKNTVFSCNGHRHGYGLGQPFQDGIWYLNTSSPSNRIYSHITIYPYALTGKRFDCYPVSF